MRTSVHRSGKVISGGMQAVLEATGSRTLENVVGGIDPAILVQALDNDLLARAQPAGLER